MSEQNNTRGKSPAGKRLAPTSSKTHKTRARTLIISMAILFMVVGCVAFCGYTAYQVLMNGDILPGVYMGQCDLSGMDRAQARAVLEKQYGSGAPDAVLDIRVGNNNYSLSVQECGLSYDIPASIDQAFAYGRQGTFLERAKQYWATRRDPQHLELQTTLDKGVLTARVDEISAAEEVPMAPSSWAYDAGVISLDKGQTGYSLDKEALLSALNSKLCTADFTPVDGVLRQSQPQALSAASIVQSVICDVVQTTLDIESDPTGNTVKAGTAGVSVTQQQVQQAIDSANRLEQVGCTITQPDYTVSEYKALLFRDVLGRCTTDFNPGNKGRTTNVLLANSFCNGVILMPGDEFSYNGSVGPRTYERGFQDAIVYVGASAEDGVGGGICQVSSTIYYAVLRADLKVTERYAHSREVTYVPKGEDATVAWGSKDFRFENDTAFPIKVVTSNTSNTLTVQLYGTALQNKTVKIETTVLSKTPFEIKYEVDETLAPGTEKVKSNGYTGYKTESYRVVYIDGKEVSRALENKSTYKKYDKVILHNPLPGATDPTAPTQPTAPPATEPSAPPATEPTSDGWVPAPGF